MHILNLCPRCRAEWAIHPADLCWRCRAEIDELYYGPKSVDSDLMNEPPIDPEDTADIQMLFNEDEG